MKMKNKVVFKNKFYIKKENTQNFLIDNYSLPFMKSNLYTKKLELVFVYLIPEQTEKKIS